MWWFLGIKPFSSSCQAGRELRHVVNRHVKVVKPLKINDPDTLLPRVKPSYPPYPYGPNLFYKQANRGLYGGKVPQFGHKVSEKFNQKSMRIFHPNVQATLLWSDALKRKLHIKLVTSVLRTITKEGGLDNYLLKDTPGRIKELGPFGWKLRFDVLKRMEEHERTEAKPLPGLAVGKARLIKDLFMAGEPETSFKQFRIEHRDLSSEELLKMLKAKGVDVEKYNLE